MRKLRIEDRPALILPGEFPSAPASGPRFGNVLSVRFEQPALERLFFSDQLTVRIAVPGRPRVGMYASVTVQEALRLGGYGSWNYVRVTPDLRGYVPVFWDVVLAARFAIGLLFVQDAAPGLDDTSAELGPQTYRLRGGGATSNRGFSPGRLGAGIEGGARRWEASLELRVPLGRELGLAVFGDAGDVNRDTAFRFDHWNAAAGFGVRYYSVLGALRLDAAWRLPGLQAVGDAPAPEFDAGRGLRRFI